MSRVVLLAAAAVAAWLLLRRRHGDGRRVLVAWEDGSELELGQGAAGRERIVATAEDVLR